MNWDDEIDNRKHHRDDIWSSLNFGLTLWMILGSITLFFAVLAGFYIPYKYVCYVLIAMLLLKIPLTYKTEEYFSLHHLLQ